MNAAQTAKLAEARAVLTQLGFPRPQSNERSALVLLCLLDLGPTKPSARATGDKLWRTHQIMQWFRDFYGKDYKPNSRETIRRQTLHQFIEAGLRSTTRRSRSSCQLPAQLLPDCSGGSGASPNARQGRLRQARDEVPDEQARPHGPTRAHARHETISVTLADGSPLTLTAGGQNVLIKEMVEKFCPRWTPGGRILYVGDAGKDDPLFDEQGFEDLGVRLDKHGKLADLVVYMADRDWLILMEAASSHGPVDGKRLVELTKLFADCTAGLVYVSCFPSRAVMRRFLRTSVGDGSLVCSRSDTPDPLQRRAIPRAARLTCQLPVDTYPPETCLLQRDLLRMEARTGLARGRCR